MVGLVLKFILAIPSLVGFFEQLMAAYVAARIASMQKENLDAIRKAITEKDQRDAEHAIGNPNPGEPSGDDGAEIIDHPPPNVQS